MHPSAAKGRNQPDFPTAATFKLKDHTFSVSLPFRASFDYRLPWGQAIGRFLSRRCRGAAMGPASYPLMRKAADGVVLWELVYIWADRPVPVPEIGTLSAVLHKDGWAFGGLEHAAMVCSPVSVSTDLWVELLGVPAYTAETPDLRAEAVNPTHAVSLRPVVRPADVGRHIDLMPDTPYGGYAGNGTLILACKPLTKA